MTSIYDINYDDIKLFLTMNGKTIPYSHEDSYNLSRKLLKSAKYYPDIIIDWIIAHNVIVSDIKVPTYTESEIYLLDDKELYNLAKLIKLDRLNISSILNVLRFLHKLKTSDAEELTDLSILSILPKDIVLEILERSNIDEINTLCSTSNKWQNFCESKEVKNIIELKIPFDSLDISNYTFNQLILYSKMRPLKQKMSTVFNQLYVLLNKELLVINPKEITIKGFSNENINQIVPSGGMEYFVNILENDGKVYERNLSMNIVFPTVYANHINSLSNYVSDDGQYKIVAIDSDGSYQESNGFKWIKISTPFKIIQKNGDLILSSEGDVYITSNDNKYNIFGKVMSYKSINYVKISNLPKIKQITALGFVLSVNGKVCQINFTNSKINKYRLSNIVQISASNFKSDLSHNVHKICLALSSKGKVTIINNNDLSILPTMSNVVEIISGQKYISILTADDKVECFSSLSTRTMMEPPYDLNNKRVLYGQ